MRASSAPSPPAALVGPPPVLARLPAVVPWFPAPVPWFPAPAAADVVVSLAVVAAFSLFAEPAWDAAEPAELVVSICVPAAD